MGMDISNGNGEYQRFPRWAWVELLKLANDYGWRPAGTELGGWELVGPTEDVDCIFLAQNECEDWDGNYTSNDGQLITAEDANAIADALERAFDDIHDYRVCWGEEMVDYFRAGALRIY